MYLEIECGQRRMLAEAHFSTWTINLSNYPKDRVKLFFFSFFSFLFFFFLVPVNIHKNIHITDFLFSKDI